MARSSPAEEVSEAEEGEVGFIERLDRLYIVGHSGNDLANAPMRSAIARTEYVFTG